MRRSAYLFPLGVVLALGGAWTGWHRLRDGAATPLDSSTVHDPYQRASANGAREQKKPGVMPPEPRNLSVAKNRQPGSRKADLLGELQRIEADGRIDLGRIGVVLRAAVRELREGDRAEVIGKAGALAAGRGLEAAGGLLSELGEFRDRHGLVRAMIEVAVGADPAKAAAWVSTLVDSPLRNAAYTAMAMDWSRLDLSAALEWAQALGDPAARVNAFEGVTWTWAQKDPKATYAWAATIPESEVRSQVLVKIAKMIAVQNPPQALDWALQFPAGPGRDQALNYALFQWATRDLEAAATWTAAVPDASLRTKGEVAIARSWSVEEAAGATNWAAGIPDPAGRTAALKTTLLKWAEVNPVAAAEWIGQRGATPANEEIFRAVSGGLATAQPAVREAWLKSVPHSEWRAAGAEIMASSPAEPPKR